MTRDEWEHFVGVGEGPEDDEWISRAYERPNIKPPGIQEMLIEKMLDKPRVKE